jgi:hypothetical protein
VQQVQIYRYDGEEWLNVISRDNALVQMGWTKEETDYLLDMLEQFDLRFVVVADRYNVSRVCNHNHIMWEMSWSFPRVCSQPASVFAHQCISHISRITQSS